MSEKKMHTKKGKNFKEVIEEEKNRGKTTKKIMHKITSIDSSVVYAGSFLLLFLVIDIATYVLLAPVIFVWAGILVVSAVVSTIFASRLTKVLKKNQWKYSS
jgi:hypothetical protein